MLFLKEVSSPSIISRLISKPTYKKNKVIRPSLIHKYRGLVIANVVSVKPREKSDAQSAWYASCQGEFAQISAIIVHAISIKLPEVE